MSEEQRGLKQAIKKIAGYLSRRPHSEKELSLKLSKTFSLEIIEQALKTAKQNQWLEAEKELAENTVAYLNDKNKSWNYIKNYLSEKSIPLTEYDRERELSKAKNLLEKKQGALKNLSYKEKIQLKQFLFYRGFEESIVDDLLD